MTSPRLFVKALAPIGSVVFALAGVLLLRAQLYAVGASSLVLAVGGFIYSMRVLEQSPFTPEELERLRPWLGAGFFWLLMTSLVLVSVFYVADNVKSAETDRIAAVAFVASVVLGLTMVWWHGWGINRDVLLARIKAHRIELDVLLVIVTAAFLLRTLDLSAHPYPWSGDEASIGIEARRILSGEITNFFETGWSSQPNWSFLPTAGLEILLGQNILAIRMASALAGVLAVLFVYLAGREMFNATVGLIAAAFLATLPYHVHFSRVGVANVVDSLFSSLLFWLILRGYRKEDARYFYTAGAVAGLSIYTYAGTRLVLILASVTFLFLILRQRSYLRAHWNHLFSFAVGAAISAAPQAAFFARHPDIFMGRFGQEGILVNGWLAGQVAQTGKSALEILFSQFTRTVMVFIASSAPGNFFNSPEPYLTVIGSILFLLGMAYALAYLLELRYFVLLTWFGAVILFGGILTLNPPANTRLLMTTPVLSLFMALGACKIAEYLQKFRLVPARYVVPVLTALTLIISYQNIHYYMVDYRSKMYFQDANGEFAMEVGRMAKDLGPDYQIFVLGEPRIFAGFPTIGFIAPENPRSDLMASVVSTLQLAPGDHAAFFAIPENRVLINEISKSYPGGKGGLVYRKPHPEEVLFEYYILSASD